MTVKKLSCNLAGSDVHFLSIDDISKKLGLTREATQTMVDRFCASVSPACFHLILVDSRAWVHGLGDALVDVMMGDFTDVGVMV